MYSLYAIVGLFVSDAYVTSVTLSPASYSALSVSKNNVASGLPVPSVSRMSSAPVAVSTRKPPSLLATTRLSLDVESSATLIATTIASMSSVVSVNDTVVLVLSP